MSEKLDAIEMKDFTFLKCRNKKKLKGFSISFALTLHIVDYQGVSNLPPTKAIFDRYQARNQVFLALGGDQRCVDYVVRDPEYRSRSSCIRKHDATWNPHSYLSVLVSILLDWDEDGYWSPAELLRIFSPCFSPPFLASYCFCSLPTRVSLTWLWM